MSEFDDWNAQIMAEFRANGGKVGGPFEGAPMVILHTTGAKTGKARETPLMCRQEGDAIAVFASKAGAPDNPDWFHNLKANPAVSIEVGDGSTVETRPAQARIAEGAERNEIWERQKAEWPQFAEYEASTERTIPVVLLESA